MASKASRGRGRWLLLALAMLLAGAGYLFYINTLGFAEQPLASDGPRELIVEPGDGFNAVLSKLRAAGVSEGSDLQWKVLAASMNAASRTMLLSRLHREGVIQVQGRIIKILDPVALKRLIETSA